MNCSLGSSTSIHRIKLNNLLKYGAFVNHNLCSYALSLLSIETNIDMMANGIYFVDTPTYKKLKDSISFTRNHFRISELDYMYSSLLLYNGYSSLMYNYNHKVGGFDLDYSSPTLIRRDVPIQILLVL